MLRDMIDCADDKSLTQGTIFNCAYCASYPNHETLGLVITARCDIANKDKVKFYNFLTAVPFDIWKNKDLLPLIKKKNLTSLIAQLSNLILRAGFSKANLDTFGYKKVYEFIVSNKKLKPREIIQLDTLQGKVDCLTNESCYKDIHIHFSDEIKRELNDIIQNKNSDYFFIDEIQGYRSVIVNLREIYELEVSIASKIPYGIELDDGKQYPGLNLNVSNKFCSIVGQVKSPYIELLLQRFANNFVRVGVNNPHPLLSSSIMEVEK